MSTINEVCRAWLRGQQTVTEQKIRVLRAQAKARPTEYEFVEQATAGATHLESQDLAAIQHLLTLV